MNRDKSIDLIGRIGRLISEHTPVVDFTDEEVARARKNLSAEEVSALKRICPDFEQFYVMQKFFDSVGMYRVADDDYICSLFAYSKRLDADRFESNPYIKTVHFDDISSGDILFSNSGYLRGEILQYDMPDLNCEVVVPRLGYFDRDVTFPTVYQGNLPWMSVCPSEINSMKEPIGKAFGRVLVLGAGLGYYPFMISASDSVSQVTVVEINPIIAEAFEKVILPQFPYRAKINVVKGDAITFLAMLKGDEFDFCFADIWEGLEDGLPLYNKIKEQEKRLSSMCFSYWIEDQLAASNR